MFGLHPEDKDQVLGLVIKSNVIKHPTSFF